MRFVFLTFLTLVSSCEKGRNADISAHICAMDSKAVDSFVAASKAFSEENSLLFVDSTEYILRNRELHIEGKSEERSAFIIETTPDNPVTFLIKGKGRSYPFIASNFEYDHNRITISYFTYPKYGYDEALFNEFLDAIRLVGFEVSSSKRACS